VRSPRAVLPLTLALLASAACGTDPGAEPAPAPTPNAVEELDRLWADVAAAQAELRLAETVLIIECLEAEGFTIHDVSSMTNAWSFQSPAPSEVLANVEDPIGLPDAAEAETRAFGQWLRFADAYGDQAGVELNAAEEAAETEADGPETSAVDLSSIEAAGEGWDALPAVEQMAWDIAYRGVDWAVTGKTASILGADDWTAVGLPGGEWVQADTVEGSPQGCQGKVLTELHGEPHRSENAFTGSAWVWGPALESDAGGFAPMAVGTVPEADGFLACLAEAGYGEWELSESGGLDLADHWRAQYLPEAARETSEGVIEYAYSDITDADRERYETVKADEFAAAAAVAACDEAGGYTEAAEARYEAVLTETLTASVPAQQAYLAELEAALAAVGV
jgi:hypothetical protein